MSLKVIDRATELFEDIAREKGMDIISVVLYGNDLYLDIDDAEDYCVLIVVDHMELGSVRKLKQMLMEQKMQAFTNPLILEMSEIEGMMDSVPQIFLNILVHYQTIYGKTLFKGLSSISQEHLRAHTERVLRDSLFQGRMELISGMGDKKEMINRTRNLNNILKCSIRMFHMIVKPWLITDEEHLEAFYIQFPIAKEKLGSMDMDSLSGMELKELEDLGYNMIIEGIRPMLDNVDEMGP